MKESTHAKAGSSIDRVTFAVNEAVSHGVGKPYIEHILGRFRENKDLTIADVRGHDMGYKEWLLVFGTPWGPVTVSNTGFGPGKMTGIFTLTIAGTNIEVHNHFFRNNGEQFSLHWKHGKASFERGPELDPKKDKSVYGLIPGNGSSRMRRLGYTGSPRSGSAMLHVESAESLLYKPNGYYLVESFGNWTICRHAVFSSPHNHSQPVIQRGYRDRGLYREAQVQ